jgi:hypothetical protein
MDFRRLLKSIRLHGRAGTASAIFELGIACGRFVRFAGWTQNGVGFGPDGRWLDHPGGRIWVAKEALWNTFGAHLGRENGLIVQNSEDARAFISEQFCY